MCLYTRSVQSTKPEIAKQDILVYKVISDNNYSFFQNFLYEPNTLYRLRKPLVVEERFIINKGFHAYLQSERPRLTSNTVHKTVAFTIPKGARYFLGLHNDIVSTSIRSGNLEPL